MEQTQTKRNHIYNSGMKKSVRKKKRNANSKNQKELWHLYWVCENRREKTPKFLKEQLAHRTAFWYYAVPILYVCKNDKLVWLGFDILSAQACINYFIFDFILPAKQQQIINL